MSREPTAEQIEAVARAIYETANPVAPEWGSAECRQRWGLWIDAAYECAHAAIAAMNDDPLTSTPEPSTTETGRQPNIQSSAGGPPERIEEE